MVSINVVGATGYLRGNVVGAVNEGARYMYDRAAQERGQSGQKFARDRYEWISVSSSELLRVIQAKGDIVQVEILAGNDVDRRVWLRAGDIGP